ncbi:lipoyl synthase [candidate division KSB1 bacterium]|nr:MAG: lipoyl synthase [candidate division KSB1 bacterium]
MYYFVIKYITKKKIIILRNLPFWLKRKINFNKKYIEIKGLLEKYNINTVCQSALCPNISHCFGNGTATFLILGKYCTRNCRFCAIEKGRPLPPSPEEPVNIAKMVEILGLSYVVITSVTRDDLPDGGAEHFARTIRLVKSLNSKIIIEVLIPDFNGSTEALKNVIEASPDILNHNIETVPRLYSEIRPLANYERSLELLSSAKKIKNKIIVKSGIMLGLGESFDEIINTMKDLKEHSCEIVTIGQYLQPTKNHYPVKKYYTPDEFEEIKERISEFGFKHIECGPLVRSSFHAQEQFTSFINNN